MLNLRKKKIVLSLDISNITANDIADALHGDVAKQDEIVAQTMKLVRAATNSIKNIPEDFKDDFEQDVLIHILGKNGRVLSQFDPAQAKFSTFIYGIVQNKWIDEYKRLLKERKETVSLDAPLKDESLSLGEVVEDPTSLKFLQELQGTAILDNILDALSDREGDILKFWVESTSTGLKRNQEVAEEFNKKYPNNPLMVNTVEQYMIRTIRPKIYKLLFGEPEQKNIPEESETERLRKRIIELDRIINKTKVPTVESVVEPEKVEELPEEEIKPFEEQIAPVYRIDPQTGERTRISSKKVLANYIKFLGIFIRKLSKV